ncbi:MAG: fatty acid desaturase [Polyangiaceae bacterium]
MHVAIIAAATSVIAAGWSPFWLLPLLSVLIGLSFAGLTFLAHETLHGCVVRNKRLRHLVGCVTFLPFTVSPTLWVAWHNRVHHGHANEPGMDPDANPTLPEYQASARVRWVTDNFALGRQNLTGIIGLLVGFTGQSSAVLSGAFRHGYLTRRQHRRALLETALGVAFWIVVLAFVGPLAFLFSYVLPLIVANVIVMAFIFTNHGLSPVTRTNDPLVNSLSVTTPRLVEWLTLGFGHHVEHHLFPAMSARRAPMVRALLLERWPDRYQSMSLWHALVTMHRTGRVYGTDITLNDPVAGGEWPALLPGGGYPLAPR